MKKLLQRTKQRYWNCVEQSLQNGNGEYIAVSQKEGKMSNKAILQALSK